MPGRAPATSTAADPSGRDRFADLLRFSAIVLVVLGHWLVAVVLHRDGELVPGQLLHLVPETRWLTFVFQVMPLFFFVGGYLNAGSWRRARQAGSSWADWMRRRARRLLVPLLPPLVVWLALGPALVGFGVSEDLAGRAVETGLIVVWFLVVYLLAITLAPGTLALHERLGLWIPGVALVLTGVVDRLHDAGVPAVGFANFLLVWGGVHQLGYFWADGRLPGRARTFVAAGVLAAAATALLVGIGGYPRSMVAVWGATEHNTSPPTLALGSYAFAQISFVLAARRPLERWVARPAVYTPVALGGSVFLTVFLWHMTAVVVAGALTHHLAVWPQSATVDAAWWATRPLWVLLCAGILVPLVVVFRRFEVREAPRVGAGPIRTLAGMAATVTGLAILMDDGAFDPAAPGYVPILPVVLVAVGYLTLGLVRGASSQDQSPRSEPARGSAPPPAFPRAGTGDGVPRPARSRSTRARGPSPR